MTKTTWIKRENVRENMKQVTIERPWLIFFLVGDETIEICK